MFIIPSVVLVRSGNLELNTVDAVDAVKEQDENEDERDLHAILKLRYDGRLREEGEELATNGERQWHDQRDEDDHLDDEEHKHLETCILLALVDPKTIVLTLNRHGRISWKSAELRIAPFL